MTDFFSRKTQKPLVEEGKFAAVSRQMRGTGEPGLSRREGPVEAHRSTRVCLGTLISPRTLSAKKVKCGPQGGQGAILASWAVLGFHPLSNKEWGNLLFLYQVLKILVQVAFFISLSSVKPFGAVVRCPWCMPGHFSSG